MNEKRYIRTQTLLAGISLAVAFLLPNTLYAVLLGWLSALLFAHIIRATKGMFRYPYLACVTAHIFAFYWLAGTIKIFGHFPSWASLLIYILFCFTNSLYFLVVPFFYRNMPSWFQKNELALPIAVTVAEFLAIRIFPWHFGHTQIAFLPFVQIADIAGVPIVTFIMFWCASALETSIKNRSLNKAFFAPALATLLVIIYGFWRMNQFEAISGESQKIVLVQGNIPIEEKHSSQSFRANIETYLSLGDAYVETNPLIIWPETVIMNALPADRLTGLKIPLLPTGPKWLIGSITGDSEGNYYNSAIAVGEDAKATDVYHKLILMPFGEYMPFAKKYPWLLDVAHMEGELSPGKDVKVLNYAASENSPELKVAPLICYEDIVSDLARRATQNGANLLVNITNDAWFGDSVAPYQHNLLASFRAIENRRFLIRATNTGLSAVIAPTGKTVSQLKTYSQGVLSTEAVPLSMLSPYTEFFGDLPIWLLTILAIGSTIFTMLGKEKNAGTSKRRTVI